MKRILVKNDKENKYNLLRVVARGLDHMDKILITDINDLLLWLLLRLWLLVRAIFVVMIIMRLPNNCVTRFLHKRQNCIENSVRLFRYFFTVLRIQIRKDPHHLAGSGSGS
jgi:hypothetical protein